MKTRLIISLIVANAVVLVACGSGSESGRSPRQIPMGYAAETSRDAAGTASDMPASAQPISYEPADGLVESFDAGDAGAMHPSWQFAAPEKPLGALQSIVDALHIGPGVKVGKQTDVPGGYTVNVTDGPTFTSYGDESSRWWWYSLSSAAQGDTAVSPPCAPDTKDCGGSWTTVPPAKHLASVGEATARARALLATMNVETDDLSFDGSADDWATRVSATYVLDGAVTPMSWSFTFGENGELTEAGGPVFAVRKGDDYPMITVSQAIDRLNRTGGNGWTSSRPTRDATMASPAAVSGTTVTLTSVRVTSVAYWTGAGTSLMLPGYSFGTGTDGTVEVVAVPERFFSVPDTADSGGGSAEPSPLPDASSEAPTMDSAGKLVGLTETEATKVADSAGWIVRVGRRDGTDLMLTQEYNSSRVNIAVEGRSVTAILSIG